MRLVMSLPKRRRMDHNNTNNNNNNTNNKNNEVELARIVAAMRETIFLTRNHEQ